VSAQDQRVSGTVSQSASVATGRLLVAYFRMAQRLPPHRSCLRLMVMTRSVAVVSRSLARLLHGANFGNIASVGVALPFRRIGAQLLRATHAEGAAMRKQIRDDELDRKLTMALLVVAVVLAAVLGLKLAGFYPDAGLPACCATLLAR
jgi:hypothetical protein